ncbi:MAG: RluA family pseudouridine synthase [bacterium]
MPDVMAEKKKITLTCAVDSYRSGWTVVEFLAHRFKYHTPERWTERVRDGWVQVNGENVEPDHIVAKDDSITYTIWHAEPEVDFKYDVIYEDDYLLAVSKSGNIPVHACGVYIQNTLIATLKNIYGDHLNLAHRLDRETSGVVLLTKDPQTARVMGKMFAAGEVEKTYLAVVHGLITGESFDVDAPIGKTMEEATGRFSGDELDSDLAADLPRYVPRRRVVLEGGKPAVTRFEVVERFGNHTLVRAIPRSGRTNQIRVHLEHIGHPIVGDKVYRPAGPGTSARLLGSSVDRPVGSPEEATEGKTVRAPVLIERQALHCNILTFDHPMTGAAMRLFAETPADFNELISRLAVR